MLFFSLPSSLSQVRILADFANIQLPGRIVLRSELIMKSHAVWAELFI
jgi:hypothetical protein